MKRSLASKFYICKLQNCLLRNPESLVPAFLEGKQNNTLISKSLKGEASQLLGLIFMIKINIIGFDP